MDRSGMTLEEAAEAYSHKVNGTHKVSRPAADWADTPVVGHVSGPEPVFPEDGAACDTWVVRGMFSMIPWVLALPATMTVYRSPADGTLTLFNAVRVGEEVEDAILALGPVRNVVKLGQFHGSSDAYYVRSEKFASPAYWTLPGGTTAPGLSADNILEAGNLPVPGANLFVFDGMPFVEAVMTVPGAGRGASLIACDGLMHMTTSANAPLLGKLMLNVFGFLCAEGAPQPAPLWLKHSVALCGRAAVERWFSSLLDLDFATVICAHGSPVRDTSHEAIAAAVASKLARY